MKMRFAVSFVSGLVFGLGLVISQMINPEKIISFLDVTGNWAVFVVKNFELSLNGLSDCATFALQTFKVCAPCAHS